MKYLERPAFIVESLRMTDRERREAAPSRDFFKKSKIFEKCLDDHTFVPLNGPRCFCGKKKSRRR